MNKHLPFRSIALTLMVVLASIVVVPSVAYCKGSRLSAKTEKTAITSALKRELGRQTPDHVKVSSFAVASLDVRSHWSLAKVKPLRQELDSVLVLMHKSGGKWKFVTLGGNLHGAGKQYNVPRSLWRPWGLDS